MAILLESSVKVLEDVSHVSPPPGSVPTISLPLTFFDTVFLGSPAEWMQRLFFYEFQYSILHFMQTTLPNLKESLSLTLQHFFPFAGNLVFPLSPQMPYILYTEGDSVSFVINESTADFNHLIGDHARHYQEFQALVPKSPSAIASISSSNDISGPLQKPLMAIQVTLFPNVGISIGVGFCHVAADGRTLAHFMKSWASIRKSQGHLTCLDNYLPSFNRDSINDPLKLASFFMKNERTLQGSSPSNSYVHNIRVSCNVKRSQVELLKDWVKKKSIEVNGSEAIIRMSTFVMTCAYMWVCLTKLKQTGTHQHLSSCDSNTLSYFHFLADCRDHLKLPAICFANCIIGRSTAGKKSKLLGENGILVAATAIGREIMEFQEQTLKEAESFVSKINEMVKTRKDTILITSSPKFGVYKTDFGWGRPTKTEVANILACTRRILGGEDLERPRSLTLYHWDLFLCSLLQRAEKRKAVLNLA